MNNLKNYLTITDEHLAHFEKIYAAYRRMHDDPANARPMFLIEPDKKGPRWEDRLADPIVMLKAELDRYRGHLDVGDDAVPTVRVQFGTAQVAAAFGCELCQPPNSLPACKTHVLKNLKDIYTLPLPSPDAGMYGRLKEFTDIFLENLPQGMHIQHPDIQGPFNTAHLVRGNDILTDFYDDPDAVEALLAKVADYMISIVPHLKAMIGESGDWFRDYYAMWKGTARISNCSTDMIGPDLYKRYVLPQDIRVLESIGGGRVHYCGTTPKVISEFFANPYVSGLDFHSKHHSLWEVAETAPKNVVLMTGFPRTDAPEIQRLLSGDWPKKRNIVISVLVQSVEEGRDLLAKLRASIPD